MLTCDHKVCPAGGTLKSYTLNVEIGSVFGVEENRAVVCVGRILQRISV
jgi:hypothetical protein